MPKGLLLSVVLLGSAVLVSAQQLPVSEPQAPPDNGERRPQQPTFSVAVEYVEVDASVLDAQGRQVRGLRKEDFRVSEDGHPQRVETLSFVDLAVDGKPASTGAAVPSRPAPDVQTNVDPFAGHVYVLLLDDLHTASARTPFVRAMARQFVEETMRPGDLAAVLHVSAPVGASQDFTSDRGLLLASIDRFRGRKVRSGALNEIDEYNRALTFGRAPVKGDDPDASTRAHDAATVFNTIGRVARQVSTIRTRRKVLLWFSEGVDVEMPQRSGSELWASQRGAASTEQAVARDRALEALSIATRSDVVVYGIDPRGLRGSDQELTQLGSIATDPTLGPGPNAVHQEVLRDQSTLRTVAEYTGGFAVVNTAEFAAASERIVRENSSYYVLGYHPTNERRDGAFRKIDVRVNRAGVEVRARRGYLAPKGQEQGTNAGGISDAPARLQDALNRPVPYPGLGMAVQASVFKGGNVNASVLVTIQYAAAAFRRAAATPADTLAVSVVAMDAAGTPRASDHRTIQFDVSPGTRQALQTLGFRTFSRLDLPAGRYQLRVASVLGTPGDVGSLRYDLEVPDFSSGGQTMSSIVVTSRVAALIPTAGRNERLDALLPAQPTTLRDFGVDDTLAFCAEVYDSSTGASPIVEAALLDDEGRAVSPVNRMQAVETPQQSPGTSAYRSSVALASLRPGAYVLRVEASPGPAAPRRVVRQIPFHVWPPPEAQPTGEQASEPVVTVTGGALSGFTAFETVVARNNTEWLALWSRLPLKRTAPAVTFDSTIVTAVFLGARPTAGYAVHITGTRMDGDTLVVEFAEQAPPATASNPPMETTPYVIAGIRRHDGPIRFERVPQ